MKYPSARKLLGRFVVALGAVCLLVAHATADDFWQTKPAADWTAKEAEKLLRDSPWAHEQVVTHPPYRKEIEVGARTTIWASETRLPDPNPSGPTVESDFLVRYLVRWESAAPVGQAFARLEALRKLELGHRLGRPPRVPEDRYVVTVLMTRAPRGGPVGFDSRDLFDDLSEEELKERAELHAGGAVVAPLEVARTPVGPISAMHFFFPRAQDGKSLFALPAGSEQVEFRVAGKLFVLKSLFKLPMEFLR